MTGEKLELIEQLRIVERLIDHKKTDYDKPDATAELVVRLAYYILAKERA